MKRFAAFLLVAGLFCLAQTSAQIPNVKIVGFGTHSTGIGGNDACTKILLTTDGSNGGTSFPDTNAGGSAHTWTATTATTSTASVKFGTAAFLGGPGRVTTPFSADLIPGSADWTIDFWTNRNGTTGAKALAGQISATGITTNSTIGVGFDASNKVVVLISQAAGFVGPGGFTSATAVTGSSYNHIAVVRDTTSIYIFINGNKDKTQAISGAITTPSSTAWGVGRMGAYTGYADYNAYIDEFRYSLGPSCGARWTTNFTPPTSAYTVP